MAGHLLGTTGMTGAELIVEQLIALGVRHVFGVGGANIEDVFAAVQRRRPEIRAILGKHEHAAGTAADAYARIGGGLGVVVVTSGGGAMNLVHALAEARAARSPVLAIVGEPPLELQGHGAFQDTSGKCGALDALAVFRAAATHAVRVATPGALSDALASALDAALGRRGSAVVLVAKDVQRAAAGGAPVDYVPPSEPALSPATVAAAAGLLRGGRVAILAGDEVARCGARRPLAAVASALDACVAVTPDGRDAFDNDDARFLGVAGAMGHPPVAAAIAEATTCLLVGTRLPVLVRHGLEELIARRRVVAIGREPPFVAPAGALHVAAGAGTALEALADALGASPPAIGARAAVRASAPRGVAGAACRALSGALPNDGIVLVDAGNTGAHAIHHVRAPRDGRWLCAMGMAGMGYTFGAAVGAAWASGRRCTAIAGDGAFFMHGLDIHTAVEHALPITYVVFDNAAHGMCLVRERILLDDHAGYNAFRRSRIADGIAAMFPGIASATCRTPDEVAAAVADATAGPGPAIVSVELDDVEVPPFAAFAAAGLHTVAREVDDGR